MKITQIIYLHLGDNLFLNIFIKIIIRQPKIVAIIDIYNN